ncbi:hypothetical protein I302_108401 [Kwoniella bestiolae CBS 10118]|uniref:Uncharacterized protein n=1 Tax=Kwoniella bestiolae CBS 10118 TaxID=1296100 RepID=A0A1B9FVT7_9TREE|nr:hypothetical protein I302_07225 [Kwoniella bestiolae CBS 10118]OCF22878.1 hypothetical protein I302_07225 [Kwoniella bestiolae CBS 10118]
MSTTTSDELLASAIAANEAYFRHVDEHGIVTPEMDARLMAINLRVREEECTDQDAVTRWKDQQSLLGCTSIWAKVVEDPERYQESFGDEYQEDYLKFLERSKSKVTTDDLSLTDSTSAEGN